MKTDYTALLHQLAVPRLVGTPNHARVRETLKRELLSRGFSIEEHEFAGRPSRALFGAPPVVRGINLIASRPSDRQTVRPSVWLVAHYDSKGQPISMAVRLLGFFAVVLGLVLLTVSTIGAVAVLAGALLVVSRNRVNDNSPGALDNATGLIAVFMTIDQLPPEAGVGVVFPDAEEFGLVGAKALSQDRASLFADSAVLNLDGLDDTGRATAFLHRPGNIGRRVAAVLEARTWRWLPVVVDGITLANVSKECTTILKGNWRTMRVVHRPEDSTDRIRLDGAAIVAAGLARVLRGK